ncbi:MAG TPA: cryptochrome/photolyase family protein, partial [Accumulibacter sp.]|nr:cryptochrome/photolyase family protein [Accumulibacter sp.]
GCHYDKKLRTGERACPYNALYWDFFARNAGTLSTKLRLGLVYRQLAKMDEATRRALQEQADGLRNSLDRL